MKQQTTIENGLDKLISGLFFGVGIAVLFVMVIVTVGIVSRYFFSMSIGWASEISGYVLAPLALLAAPKMLRDGGHIRVDLILRFIGEKKSNTLRAFGSTLGIVIFSIIFIFAMYVTFRMFQGDVRTDSFLRLPRFILIGLSALGFVLIAIQYFRNLVKTIRTLREKQVISST